MLYSISKVLLSSESSAVLGPPAEVCEKSASNANAGAAAESLYSGFSLHSRPVRGQSKQLAKCAALILHNSCLFPAIADKIACGCHTHTHAQIT